MNRSRIALKLGFIIVSVFVIVLLVLGLTVYQMFANFYMQEMKSELKEMTAHFIAMEEKSQTTSEEMLMTFADFSNVSLYYINAAGKITFHSGQHDSPNYSFIRSSDLNNIFAGQTISLEHEDELGERFSVFGEPIYKQGKVTSAIYVMTSMKSLDTSLAAVRNLLMLAGVGALCLAIGITWIISTLVSRPLIQMQQATQQIAKGKLTTRIDIHQQDEIGDLALAINNLAVDLQRYHDTRHEFYANISHELRTPITYLEGYANVLKQRLYDSEEEKEQCIDIIHQEAYRMERLVADVFELDHMEAGTYPIHLEPVHIPQLIEQTVAKVQLKASEKGLRLGTRIAVLDLYVRADRLRMEQVLLNLLENAVRYTDHGSVQMTVESLGGQLAIHIEDTGRGISQEDLPYIFDPFYRVEKSRSRQHGGTGLGLSIVKKLVVLQGGTIEVRSQLGRGSCFSIYMSSLAVEGDMG